MNKEERLKLSLYFDILFLMAVSPKNQKVIWGDSAARCAICKKKLIMQASNNVLEPVGEIAHIEGENEGSKRYNSGQSSTERDDPRNLLLLCPTDHTIVDRDDVEYTVEKLRKIKNDHSNFINASIKSELPNLTFAELQVIVSYLVSSGARYNQDSSLDHIPPKEKMDRNKLSVENQNLLTMGMTRVKQVKEYLNSNPDVNFSERLRTKLSGRYIEEKAQESDPDNIFANLLNYMAEESSDFKKKAAALAVLTYFFETCDIFEK